ncbi:MAG: hypothetical protein HKN68_10755 [Saprospiraceae bacterium]|nr:hypothetical protein [Saprospiraceae bacterium]
MIVCLIFTYGINAQSTSSLFDDEILHEVKIEFSEAYPWDSLISFYGFNLRKEYIPVKVTIDGTTLDSVGIRYKGISSFAWAKNDKKPLKLDFNEFVDDQSYRGVKKVNLHNAAADPSMLREYLGYKFLSDQGLPASRTVFSKVFINGKYWGLYLMVEQVDKTFLKHHLGVNKGMLVKNKGRYRLNRILESKKDLEWYFDVKIRGEDQDYQQFLHLTNLINLSDDATFEKEISEIFDVDGFLKTVAVRLAIKDQDSFHTNGNNYYLYYNTSTGKILMIPWDLNLTMDLVLDLSKRKPRGDCDVRAYFTYDYLGNNVFQFKDQRFDPELTSTWNFDDGTTLNEKNPVHQFSREGRYEVCLEVRDIKHQNCTRSYCSRIYTIQSNKNCISNIPDHYKQNLVHETITRRARCCDMKWDNTCDLIYRDLDRSGKGQFPISSERNYSLEFLNARNPLMSRLMGITKYRNFFLMTVKDIIDVFQSSVTHADIQEKHQLIKKALEQDPHFVYPIKSFNNQYKTYIQSGKPNSEDTTIPTLNEFLKERALELKKQISIIQK